MMRFFDRFVDTRAKRKALIQLIAVLLILYMVTTYLRLARHLIWLASYEDLFALLQITYIKQTYIARMILSCMELAQLNLLDVLKNMFISLRFLDILTTFCFIALACYPQQKKRRTYQLALVLWGVGILLCAAFAFVGLQATTLQGALTQLHTIGIIFLISCMSVLLILSYKLLWIGKEYREALRYDAVELAE